MALFKKLLDKASHQEEKTSSVELNTVKFIYEQKYSQSHSFKG